MAKCTNVCLLILMLKPGLCQNEKATRDPPGHNQPFGSHTQHLDVPVMKEFPHPKIFFQDYMMKSRPFIVRSILNSTTFPAVEKWTDEFFRKQIGQELILAEKGKRENRNEDPEFMSVEQFLDVYEDREVYMVQGLYEFPSEAHVKLLDDIYIPRSLLCGGLQKNVESLVLWLSSGGTKSVLHSDDYENFNCVLDGTKEFVLIDKKYNEQVKSAGFHEDGSHSDVDVDKVDMYKFPRLQETTVYKARLTKGDCLYIPFQWYHQVNSPGSRSLAINFWFATTKWFNFTHCDNTDLKQQTEPFNKYGINRDYISWMSFIEVLTGEDISKSEYDNIMMTEYPNLKHLHNEVFDRLDKDKSSSLSLEERLGVDERQILEDFPDIKTDFIEDKKSYYYQILDRLDKDRSSSLSLAKRFGVDERQILEFFPSFKADVMEDNKEGKKHDEL